MQIIWFVKVVMDNYQLQTVELAMTSVSVSAGEN
jgi:hypothetical protein